MMKRIICILVAMSLFSCVFCGCAETHACSSKCSVCGYCTDADCKEEACKKKCTCKSSVPDSEAEVEDVVILSYPVTEYIPGQVFDISGLSVSVKLSNGNTKKIRYSKFTYWTYKDQPLTEAVTKITFELPGYDYYFDIPISVKRSETMMFIADGASLPDYIEPNNTVDLAVKAFVVDGEKLTAISDTEYSVYVDGQKIAKPSEYAFTSEGNKKISYEYQGMKSEYTISVIKNNGLYPYVHESETSTWLNEMTEVKDEQGKVTERIRGKELNSKASWYMWNINLQSPEADGTLSNHGVVGGVSAGRFTYYFEAAQAGYRTYFEMKATVPEEGDYDIMIRANVQSSQQRTGSIYEVCVNGEKDSNGLYTYTQSTSDDLLYNGSQLHQYSSNYSSSAGYNSWNNLTCWSTARVETVHLKKGANTVKFRYARGGGGYVDYFYLQPTKGTDEQQTGVFAARDGEFIQLGGEKIFILTKGQKLSSFTNTPDNHLVQYTNIFYRFESGFELNITENMISGIDYNRTGVQTVTVNTGTFYKQSATTTFKVLVVED